jgi:SAM-dependent methyltransferase
MTYRWDTSEGIEATRTTEVIALIRTFAGRVAAAPHAKRAIQRCLRPFGVGIVRLSTLRQLQQAPCNDCELEVRTTRRTIARLFIKSGDVGIEVGAGTRPWPLPDGAKCLYGDIRDEAELQRFFSTGGSPSDKFVDAQTFTGIPDAWVDFVLSAHVLEHLINPIGAIEAAMRTLRVGGLLLLAVPDMRHTWDKDRPLTPLAHLISDYRTGGEDTRHEACREHLVFLAPQWGPAIPAERIEAEVMKLVERRFDTHYHTWTSRSFAEMLIWCAPRLGFEIMHVEFVVNENIAVLKRCESRCE